MDEATRAAWESGPYAKCLRDAAATREAQRESAEELWEECFSDAACWIDPQGDPLRPTENEAVQRVFWECKGADSEWAGWMAWQERQIYGRELDDLAAVVEMSREKVKA